MRDSRFDILFKPVAIGPKRARNRFYQVPHCNGMGWRAPQALAAMRGVKAEGGWAVVATEECEIHPSSDITPFVELRLWDRQDLDAARRIVEAVHAHGALAAIELVHNGLNAANRTTREPPIGPSSLPVLAGLDPVHARAMDREDIRAFRNWHREAVARALEAGFDIVYVYAGHGLSLIEHFLCRRFNHRSDEYGGSLTNRARLLREVLEDTRELAEGRAAVALRLSAASFMGAGGLELEEAAEVVAMLAELPDLWDFCFAGWEWDSRTSRFAAEGYAEDTLRRLRSLTSRPVVGIGRYTSPDSMARIVREGIVDLVGAARPSIADPFLPRKIEEGRIDEIRECIGCNICVVGDWTISPIRCTQNPTMGEEWRRGWHPERLRPKGSEARILVVGGGPAGLECSLALARRGYRVTLAEAEAEFGGRVLRESRLPGFASWLRVRDYRLTLLSRLPRVELYRKSRLAAEDVLAFGAEHVVLATGARWRRDGVGRHHGLPLPLDGAAGPLTPDDILDGRRPEAAPVLLYDDDHAHMGGALAELLAREGYEVLYVSPAPEVSSWTRNTMEQPFIQARLLELGVALLLSRALVAVRSGCARLRCVYTGREEEREIGSLLLVTARLPEDGLEKALRARRPSWKEAGIRSVRCIGDARAPATIAHAVYDGRRWAEELDLDAAEIEAARFRRMA